MVVQVTLLGRAAIHTAAARLEPPPGKLTALLYYVAYQESWVNRDDLVYLFYPDLEEHKARQNLRPLLTKLRRLPWAAGLEIEPTRLRWDVPTDTRAFTGAVAKGTLEAAVGHYRGELLSGFRLSTAPEFESWLELERSELHALWVGATLLFTGELESQGRHDHAAELLKQAYKADPLDEAIFRRYFAALAGAGRKSDALRAFETFQALLSAEVASEPEQATCDLVEDVRSGKKVRAEDKPPAKLQRPAKPKTPLPTTLFVGRATEVGRVVAQLREPACRLLSILGPGGIGKTRLAVEVGRVLTAEFADGTVFAPFDGVDTPALMVSALADALHLTFVGGRDPAGQLLEHLADKHLLLVMDNLEHLLEGIDLVTEILQAAPNLKILATSRERLGLHAEWVYDLAGMRVPEVGRFEEADLETADAVKLFAQTAKKARADFALNGDVATVAHICRALGGMPLAIELAASWLRVLSVAEVAAELEKGSDLLESSLRDLPARHHDLRAVFDTSWQRLSGHEQAALHQLTVFQGGFTKEAAREVAETGLPLLLALVNKSFLSFEGWGRFAQHPLIRQYLRDKAALEPDFARTQVEHARYYATFMQRREALHQGMAAKTVRAEISPDLSNVQAAWSWAAAHKSEDLLDRMSEGVLEVYTGTGRYKEAEKLFAYAAEKVQSRSVVHGRILRNLGHVHNWQLEYEQAAELLKTSIVIFREQDSKHDEALALSYLTINYSFSSRPSSEVQDLREKAVALFGELGDKNNEARQLSNLAEYYPDPQQREAAFREAIQLFREVDGYFGITLSLCNLAFSQATTWGAYREAEALINEAITVERERGMAFRLAWWLNCQGNNHLYQGRLGAAETRFTEAKSIGESLEPGFGMWELEKALAGLGRVAHLRGDNAGARNLFAKALRLNTRHADPMDVKTNILLDFSKLALSEHALAEAEDLCCKTGFDHLGFYELSYYVWEEVGYLNQLGAVAAAREEPETAARRFRQALALAEKWHFLPAALHVCVNFADLAREHDEKRALTLFKLAFDHPATLFDTREAAKRGLETLCTRGEEVDSAAERAPTLAEVVKVIGSS
ncbi:BTAD domain-containing putative transcriptional regulator [soil metagenome]